MKNIYSPMGSRISSARNAVNMGQADLAAKLGVHPSQISTWENDRNTPSVEAVLKIAEITEAELVWLLTGEVQERVSLKPITRALVDAYVRADENKKRIVRLTLEIDDPKGDKHNLPLALIRKKKPKSHDKTHEK